MEPAQRPLAGQPVPAAGIDEDRRPANFTWAKREEKYGDPDNYLTSMNSVQAYFTISGVATFPHKVHFYNYARAFPLSGGQVGTSEWYLDMNIWNMRQNLWTKWGSVVETTSSISTSELLGSIDGVPEWCVLPVDPLPLGESSTYAAKGFTVELAAALVSGRVSILAG